MNAPQGYFTWPRMRDFLWGSFSFAHGLQPSIAQLTCIAQEENFAEVGSLGIHYGGMSMVLNDCKLVKSTTTVDSEGRQITSLAIADRRWRWRGMGRVSGFYNTTAGGSSIRQHSKAGLRNLIAACLTALYEKDFDLSRVEEDPRTAPVVEWDYEDPLVALGQLLEFGKLRLVLRRNGKVAVYQRGDGTRINFNDNAIIASQPIDSPDRPSHLVVAFGRTEYEQSLELEPVALNRRLEWVPLDDVEYAPKPRAVNNPGILVSPWAFQTPDDFSNITDSYDRSLAEQSVFKAYRIKTPFRLHGNRIILNRAEILPILPERIKTHKVNGVDIREHPIVRGVFNGGFEFPDPRKKNEDKLDGQFGVDLGILRYARGFQILQDSGVVLFDDPLYRIIENGQKIRNIVPNAIGGAFVEVIPKRLTAPASPLQLTCAFNLREKVGEKAGDTIIVGVPPLAQVGRERVPLLTGWSRYEKSFPVGNTLGGGNRPAYIVNNNWSRQIAYSRKEDDPGAFWTYDNASDLQKFARSIVKGELDRLNFSEGRMVTYIGFNSPLPDGLVAQTSFMVDSEGRATSEVQCHIEDLTSYQATRDYLAMVKADRETAVIRSAAKAIEDARKRAL